MSTLPGGVIAVGLVIVGMLLLSVFAIQVCRVFARFHRTYREVASNTQNKVSLLRARSAALRVAILDRLS